jgi:hypothetical protein
LGEIGPSQHELGKTTLVLLLGFEQLADLEPCQLATDVVLGLHGLEEFEACNRLLDDCAQLEIVYEVYCCHFRKYNFSGRGINILFVYPYTQYQSLATAETILQLNIGRTSAPANHLLECLIFAKLLAVYYFMANFTHLD